MNTIDLMTMTIFAIIIIGLLFCFYMLNRNNKTYNLRLYFLRKTKYYDKLPEYNYMMLSFKPLTKKYWIKWINDNR